MKKLMVLLTAFVMGAGLLPAADGWDVVSLYYKSVGVLSYSAPAIADIDADGDQDIFLGDLDGKLSYFRNDGTAQAPVFNVIDSAFDSIDVGSYCSPALTDIDGDGDQDLFLGNSSGNISFYRNDGSASAPLFRLVDASYYMIDVGSNAAPVFGDLDGDGDPDMLIGTSSGTIYHYRNEGTAQAAYWVQASTYYDTIDVGSYAAPALIDIDADGDLDLFVGNSGGTIGFYRNDGTALSPAWNLIDATYFMIDIGSYSTPAFADLDGDNDLDLFIGESAGNINFHRNEGTAQAQYFATVSDIYSAVSGGSYSAPLLVDMDKDGDRDLVIGCGDGTFLYYKNTGGSGAAVWQADNSAFNGIDVGDNAVPALADLDNDGDLDLLAGKSTGTISYYRNDGSATSPAFTLVDANYHSLDVGSNSAPAFTDIDGDGDVDLFIGTYSGTIYFYRNQGTVTAPYWALVSATYGSFDVGYNAVPSFCDLDDDGDQDMYVGTQTGIIYFYYNGGTALAPDLALVSDYYGSIDIGSYAAPAFGDIDGDGDLDLLLGKSDGYLAYCRNSGVHALLYWRQVSTGYLGLDVGYYATPALTDIDGDGDLDLFVGNNSGYISFYRNDGTAGEPACTLITTNYDSIYAATYAVPVFVDIDNDGDQDLMIGKYDGTISFYRNDGTMLSPSWTLLDAMYFNIDVGSYAAPAFADIDSDGDQDMFIGDYYGRITFYRNEGAAASPYWKLESSTYQSIDVGYNSIPTFLDIDGDGDQDLFVGEEDGYVNFWRNDSTASAPKFVYESSNFNAIDVGTHAAPVFADLDGDGNMGLFVGDYYGRIAYWEALNPIVGMEKPEPVEFVSGLSIGLTPHPVTDMVTVSFGTLRNGPVSLRVFDAAGREMVRRDLVTGNSVRLDTRQWAPGLYILDYRDGAVRTARSLTIVR